MQSFSVADGRFRRERRVTPRRPSLQGQLSAVLTAGQPEHVGRCQQCLHGLVLHQVLPLPLLCPDFTQKSPDTPGSPEGNTEGPGTASSEPLLPS